VATLFSVIIYEILKLIVLQQQYKMNPLSRNYLWALLGVGLYIVAAHFLPQVDYSWHDFPVFSNVAGVLVLLTGGYFIKTKLASFE
jgi:hypothetical protein